MQHRPTLISSLTRRKSPRSWPTKPHIHGRFAKAEAFKLSAVLCVEDSSSRVLPAAFLVNKAVCLS